MRHPTVTLVMGAATLIWLFVPNSLVTTLRGRRMGDYAGEQAGPGRGIRVAGQASGPGRRLGLPRFGTR